MGRTLITKTLPGEMTKKQIEGEFERLSQAAAVASDYHDYSGSWNTFVEVDVVEKDRSGKGLVFESYEDAEDYVFRLSDEMGPVCLAVRVATRDKKRGQIVEWLMGGAALC